MSPRVMNGVYKYTSMDIVDSFLLIRTTTPNSSHPEDLTSFFNYTMMPHSFDIFRFNFINASFSFIPSLRWKGQQCSLTIYSWNIICISASICSRCGVTADQIELTTKWCPVYAFAFFAVRRACLFNSLCRDWDVLAFYQLSTSFYVVQQANRLTEVLLGISLSLSYLYWRGPLIVDPNSSYLSLTKLKPLPKRIEAIKQHYTIWTYS